MTKRELFIKCIEGLLGTPYEWGGDNPLGIDCSGTINIGAQLVGKLGAKEDRTAEGWYQHSKPAAAEPGNLIFYKNQLGKVVHVEMIYATVEGVMYSIGAAGGDSTTKTVADAEKRNAFVKIHAARPSLEIRSIFE